MTIFHSLLTLLLIASTIIHTHYIIHIMEMYLPAHFNISKKEYKANIHLLSGQTINLIVYRRLITSNITCSSCFLKRRIYAFYSLLSFISTAENCLSIRMYRYIHLRIYLEINDTLYLLNEQLLSLVLFRTI